MINLNGCTVLVVVAHCCVRWMVREVLATRGASVKATGRGAKGLNLFSERRPDLIIADLASLDIQACELSGHNWPASNIPILVLSALGPDLLGTCQCGERHVNILSLPFDSMALLSHACTLVR